MERGAMAGETGKDDPIIELTEIVEDDADSDLPLHEDIIELTDSDADAQDEVMEDIWEDPTLPEEDLPDMVPMSTQQLETALERVIERKFAEKIEPMLFEAMERVIAREIKKIKESLQKDLDQIHPS
jgi:hypothetical protein